MSLLRSGSIERRLLQSANTVVFEGLQRGRHNREFSGSHNRQLAAQRLLGYCYPADKF